MLNRLRLRRFRIREARRYMHARRFRECWVGFFCWTCAWRSATGFFEREQAALRKRADEVAPTIPAVKVNLTDEQKVRGLTGRMLNQMKANGEVLCSTEPFDHFFTELAPCRKCGAAL